VTPAPTASTTPAASATEQEREVVVDATLAVVQIGVAHRTRLDLHHRLARSGVGHHDGLDAHRLALAPGHDPTNLLRHHLLPFVDADR
jgi:hypothetical protein